MKLLRSVVVFLHRYLGIVLSLLFVLWFASGIVMIYTGGMPALSPQSRLDHMPPLDLSAVQITPAQAATRAGLTGAPARAVLLTIMDRPAYRFAGRPSATVFADTNEPLAPISIDTARTVAGQFVDRPAGDIRHVATIDKTDQWTLLLQGALPLEKFHVEDGAGTEIYVSLRLAEVILITTRSSRALAWIGAIPHWLYFKPLRSNGPLWYQIVVWGAGLGCGLAVLGLVLGVTEFRRSRPFRLAASIPYVGWLRWHYMLGAIFGVFTLTWVFSGLLSMEPFEWTNASGLEVPYDVMTGGPLELTRFPPFDATALQTLTGEGAIREIELTRIQDEPFYLIRSAGIATAPEPLLVDAQTSAARREPFSVESIVARLQAAVPDVAILDRQLLTDYDAYYYARNNAAPLPVLRVKFDDPAQTWYYIDPRMSEIVAGIHRYDRVERWLYNGLHSLDFSFWYDRRPLWDIGVILLCLGGLAGSAIGVYLGFKRLLFDLRRLTQRRSPVQGR